MTQHYPNSKLSINDSASLVVTGIHADGRRSSIVSGAWLTSGQWAGTGNVIRVEDGGLIDVDSLDLRGHTFTEGNTHSTLVVSGVHASGVPSTVKAQGIVMGRRGNNTSEIHVLDGGVLEVRRIGSYAELPIVISGSGHRSTFRFHENAGYRALPKLEVLDGGLLEAGGSVSGAHVSGVDHSITLGIDQTF